MNSKPCVYISGPMSGYEDFNYPAFNELASHLRSLGFPVMNPADFGYKDGEDWAACLKRDLAVVVHCDAIIAMEGWQKSRGANLEIYVAKALGIPVVTYAQLLGGDIKGDS